MICQETGVAQEINLAQAEHSSNLSSLKWS